MMDSKQAILELQSQADAMASGYGDEEPTAKIFRQIAYLISKLEDEKQELAVHLDKTVAVAADALKRAAELEKARQALDDLLTWFTTPQVGGRVWIIPAGNLGADDAVNNARLALQALAEGGGE